MYSVLDAIPMSLDNWVMYLAMSVCYGLESVFFTMRIILMDLIAGSDILIGALFAFSFTREMSMETIKYFGKITLLQFIIVLLTAFGISIIESLPTGKPLGYLCLILILVVVSGGLVFGFSRIFSASKTVIKGVI
jgi:peptidoglycan/LPS O-acetylase OafA/YrhL